MATSPSQYSCIAHGAIRQVQESQVSGSTAANAAAITQNASGAVDIEFKQPIFWPNGYELKIAFADGNQWQQGEVQKYAVEWCQWANLSFKFVIQPPYDIFISFQAGSSWSLLGTPLQSYRATILHEFGHALGMTHEHQNPEKNLHWNAQAVYAFYAQPPNNWDATKVNFNSLSNVTGRVFSNHYLDEKSIMLYTFPKHLFVGGEGTTENFDLSELDKTAMLMRYPGRDFQGMRPSKTPGQHGDTWISQDTFADIERRNSNPQHTLSIDLDFENKDQAGNWMPDGFTVAKLSGMFRSAFEEDQIFA